MIDNDFSIFFTTVGVSISALLAISFLWNRKRPYVFLGVLFLCNCLILIDDYFWKTQQILNVPFLAEWVESLPLLIPPLLYFYTIHNQNEKWNNKNFLHFIPAFLAYVNTIPFFVQSSGFKKCYVEDELFDSVSSACLEIAYDDDKAFFISDGIIDILLIIQFVIYSILIFRKLTLISSSKSKKTVSIFQQWGKLLVIAIVWSILILILDNFILHLKEIEFIPAFLTVISIVFSVFIIKQSIILEDNFQSNVYQNLQQTEIDKLWENAHSKLMEEKLYAQENLSLNILSKKLNTTSNQLSFVLNKKEMTFKALVNKIRIEKAIELLSSEEVKNYSIEGIGRQIGYKSKTTFYKHFKEKTGKTPREFMNFHSK